MADIKRQLDAWVEETEIADEYERRHNLVERCLGSEIAALKIETFLSRYPEKKLDEYVNEEFVDKADPRQSMTGLPIADVEERLYAWADEVWVPVEYRRRKLLAESRIKKLRIARFLRHHPEKKVEEVFEEFLNTEAEKTNPTTSPSMHKSTTLANIDPLPRTQTDAVKPQPQVSLIFNPKQPMTKPFRLYNRTISDGARLAHLAESAVLERRNVFREDAKPRSQVQPTANAPQRGIGETQLPERTPMFTTTQKLLPITRDMPSKVQGSLPGYDTRVFSPKGGKISGEFIRNLVRQDDPDHIKKLILAIDEALPDIGKWATAMLIRRDVQQFRAMSRLGFYKALTRGQTYSQKQEAWDKWRPNIIQYHALRAYYLVYPPGNPAGLTELTLAKAAELFDNNLSINTVLEGIRQLTDPQIKEDVFIQSYPEYANLGTKKRGADEDGGEGKRKRLHQE